MDHNLKINETLSVFGGVTLTRNILRELYPDDEEFHKKVRRVNFLHRAMVVSLILAQHVGEGIISFEGFGDWLTTAKLLQENGWFQKVSDEKLAEVLKGCCKNLVSQWAPEEIFGEPTIPNFIKEQQNEGEEGPE